jgi:Domain of unknown function (DUF4258)
MALILTKHVQSEMIRRRLQLEWIERTVNAPDWTRPDPLRSGVTRSFRRIPEIGGRVLRVAHRPSGADIVIITAHPDRNAKP